MRLPPHTDDASQSSRTNHFANQALQQGRGQPPQPDARVPSLQNRPSSDASDWTEELDEADEALPLPVEDAQAIHALLYQLTALKPPLANKLGAIDHLCQAMKGSNADTGESDALITRLLRDYPEAVEVRQLRSKFSAFLQDFHAALQSTHSQRQIKPESLTQQQIQHLCQALSVCLPASGQRLFEPDYVQQDSRVLQGITDVLLTQATALGLPEAVQANGEVLDILNWVSRGLKAGLLMRSEPIRQCSQEALPLFESWVGGDQCRQLLSEHNLGRCAVQIGTIQQYQLIDLDPAQPEGAAHRQRLGQCALQLCAKPVLDRLLQQGDTVSLLNISNTVKDQLIAGVLRQNDTALAELLPALNRLLDAIGSLPASALYGSLADCQPLSNFSNLLRTLAEPAGKDQPALAEQLPQFEPTCEKFVDTICGVNLKQVYPSRLAASNLKSFVKVCDKRVVKRMAETAIATKAKALSREQLGQAAGILIGVLIGYGAAEFTQPRAIGGVLAGLAYFWVCNPALRSDALQDLIKALVANAGAHRWADWNDQSRRAVLPALTLLLREGTIDLHVSQPALQQIMGSSHAVTLQTLQMKSREYKLADEVPLPMPVVLLAPVAEMKEVEKKEEVPAERVIPGLTRLRAPVVMTTTNTTHTTTTTTVTPTYRGQTTTTPPPFQAPKKVAKFKRTETVAMPHSEPVVVVKSSTRQTQKQPEQKQQKQQEQPTNPTSTSANGKVNAVKRKTITDASDKEEWFALLMQEGGDPVRRLKTLAKNNKSLLTQTTGKGKSARSALFYAITTGKPEAATWLAQTAGPGKSDASEDIALLEMVFAQIGMVDEQVAAALDAYLKQRSTAVKVKLAAHFHEQINSMASVLLAVLKRHDMAPLAADTLIEVVKNRDIEQVRKLLLDPSANALLMAKDKDGWNALMLAISLRQPEMVKLLLKHDSASKQVMVQNKNGLSPLIVATMTAYNEMVTQLLAHPSAPAQLQLKDSRGDHALIWAAFKGHTSIAMQLCEHPVGKVLLTQQNIEGRNALMHAAQSGNQNMVDLLLGNPSGFQQLIARDRENRNAPMIATFYGHHELADHMTKIWYQTMSLIRAGIQND